MSWNRQMATHPKRDILFVDMLTNNILVASMEPEMDVSVLMSTTLIGTSDCKQTSLKDIHQKSSQANQLLENWIKDTSNLSHKTVNKDDFITKDNPTPTQVSELALRLQELKRKALKLQSFDRIWCSSLGLKRKCPAIRGTEPLACRGHRTREKGTPGDMRTLPRSIHRRQEQIRQQTTVVQNPSIMIVPETGLAAMELTKTLGYYTQANKNLKPASPKQLTRRIILQAIL